VVAVWYHSVMKIPKELNLHSQTFNSEFIEFVWQFPQHNQVIFKVYKDNKVLLKEGTINDAGDYTNEDGYMTSAVISTKNLSMDELSRLKNEVIEYLQ
jgi:hypothetical protein